MSHCQYCTLLCEVPANESTDLNAVNSNARDSNPVTCPLRVHSLSSNRSIVARTADRVPRVGGIPVSYEEAIDAARRIVSSWRESTLLVTGNFRSVEASRAALHFAAKFQAIIDPEDSDASFSQILAVQRQGAMTATLSEIRFRSDCVIIAGGDAILDSMPRLPSVLKTQTPSNESPQRVVLVGDWSENSIEAFRKCLFDVRAIQIDLHNFPKALRDWSRLSPAEQIDSNSDVSHWLHSANYLAIVWSPEFLHSLESEQENSDGTARTNRANSWPELWIEQLQGWINDQNLSRRVVGVPLAGRYQTFQQVATWITGFPGRVQFKQMPDGSISADYQPHRNRASSLIEVKSRPIVVHIDDEGDDRTFNSSLKLTGAESRQAAMAPDILIGPVWSPQENDTDKKQSNGKQTDAPKVFLPCLLAGFEIEAQMFRTDAVYVAMIKPTKNKSDRLNGLDSNVAEDISSNRIHTVSSILESIGKVVEP